jgi:sugar O-acyltransferase (sialic acid O-acetyltransferase NeuD family)
MRDILIIGAGGHARPVISAISEMGRWNIVGILDVNFRGQPETIGTIPILGGMDKIHDFHLNKTDIAVASGDNLQRSNIQNMDYLSAFKFPNIIHPTAYIDKYATVGSGNFIGPFAYIGAMASIGSGNLINTKASIDHEVVLGDFSQLAPSSVVCGRCKIGDKVLIGANATVLNGLEIADETIVGAGAVIDKSIYIKGRTYVGIPGKVL